MSDSAATVLDALTARAAGSGVARVGQDALAATTQRSIRTVRRALLRLEAEGLIERQREFDASGRRRVDVCRLAPHVR